MSNDAEDRASTDTSGVNRQLREARETLDNAGGIFGGIMGFIPWILVALVALPFISMIPGIRESGFGQWVRGMVDQGMMMVENMTNGGLFSGTTQRVLDNATPENRADILEQGGLPEAAAAYIADNANYTAIKNAVGGNIRTLSTAAGMAQLIERAPTHARGLIDAFARGRATATTTTALPPAITNLLQDQTAFARLMGNAEARGVILHAVEVLGPRREGSTTEPMMTSAQLEGLLGGTPPALSVEDFRSLAVRALRGDNISADVARLAGVVAATAPVETIAETLIPDTAPNATEARASVAAMITNLRSHFTTEQVTTITGALTGTGAINPITIIQSMYTANAAGANAFLSNADNLAAINTLIAARTPATTTEPAAPQPLTAALLGNATGRTAVAGLVRDLAAIDPQAPAQLMTILAMPASNEAEQGARTAALLQLMRAGGDETKINAYIAAFRGFSQGISSIEAPAGSEMASLKTMLTSQLPTLTRERVIAGADIATNAPTLLPAVDRIRANSTRLEYGVVEALMNDQDRAALLGRNPATGAANSVVPLAQALALEAQGLDANAQRAVAYLTQNTTVGGTEGPHRLAALVNLVDQIDQATGGEQGSAAETAADAANARVISFMTGMLQGGRLELIENTTWSSDARFKVTGADGEVHEASAEQIAAFFANPGASRAFRDYFLNMRNAAPQGSASRRLFDNLTRNFWADDGDGVIESNEGIVNVFSDASALGTILVNTALDANFSSLGGAWNFFTRGGHIPIAGSVYQYGDTLGEIRDLGTSFVEELGRIALPVRPTTPRTAPTPA